jgi:hypothetical protein
LEVGQVGFSGDRSEREMLAGSASPRLVLQDVAFCRASGNVVARQWEGSQE